MYAEFERRLQSDCVHEQVAKADCDVRFTKESGEAKRSRNKKQLDTTNTNESKKDGCDKKRESEVFHEPNRELAGGVLLVICVLAISTAIPLVILMICYRIWFWLGFAVQSYMCYTILATKSLKTESMKVAEVLQTDGLEAGRKAVSMIVGRDTQNLTETGVVKDCCGNRSGKHVRRNSGTDVLHGNRRSGAWLFLQSSQYHGFHGGV